MKREVNMLTCVAILALSLAMFPLTGCSAADVADPPEIGAIFPNFALPDLDGAPHTLEQYRGKVVVIEMASQHCPWSRGADPHLVELANKYKDDGVVFIGIDSHNDTPVAAIKTYVEEHGKSYVMLKDEGNQYADVLGARVTPEVYVLDREGKLVYHGAFDNRANPTEKGDEAYTDRAVQAALAGTAAEPNRVKAWGCGIKRK